MLPYKDNLYNLYYTIPLKSQHLDMVRWHKSELNEQKKKIVCDDEQRNETKLKVLFIRSQRRNKIN